MYKMYMLVFGFLIFIISNTTAQSESDLIPCKTDNECPIQNYCYQTGFCAKCINCAQYNKQNVTCAKYFDDCGSCIEGYESNPAAVRFDGKTSKYCIKSQTQSTSGVAVISNQTKAITNEINIQTNPSGTEITPMPKFNLSTTSPNSMEPTITSSSSTETNLSETTSSGTQPTNADSSNTEANLSTTSPNSTEPTPTSPVTFSAFVKAMIVIALMCIVLTILRSHTHIANRCQCGNADIESGNQNPTAPLIHSSDTIGHTNEDQGNTGSSQNLLEDGQNQTNASVQFTNINILNISNYYPPSSSPQERGNEENALLLYQNN